MRILFKENNQSYEKQSAIFMVTFSVAAHLSTQQFYRTADKFGGDHHTRVSAPYFSCAYRLDVGGIYHAREKVEGAV
jgi:hypothetical protein